MFGLDLARVAISSMPLKILKEHAYDFERKRDKCFPRHVLLVFGCSLGNIVLLCCAVVTSRLDACVCLLWRDYTGSLNIVG